MRPPEPFTFFVDRCLGRTAVPTAMRARLQPGEQIQILHDLYPPDVKDEVWIPEVGAKGWIIVTKDKAIQRRPIEQNALLAASTAVFVFSRGGVKGDRIANALTIAMPAMRKATRRFAVPVLGRVNLAGEVYVAWEANTKLATPRRVKVQRTGFKDE